MSPRTSLRTIARTLVGPGLGLLAACARGSEPAPPAASEPHALEGVWEDDRGSNRVEVTIAGGSLHFYERPDHQFDTTFTLTPDTDPPELHATIIESPRTTDGVGQAVVAIYELDGDTLRLAAVNKIEGEPVSFDRVSNDYRLVRVAARE